MSFESLRAGSPNESDDAGVVDGEDGGDIVGRSDVNICGIGVSDHLPTSDVEIVAIGRNVRGGEVSCLDV